MLTVSSNFAHTTRACLDPKWPHMAHLAHGSEAAHTGHWKIVRGVPDANQTSLALTRLGAGTPGQNTL